MTIPNQFIPTYVPADISSRLAATVATVEQLSLWQDKYAPDGTVAYVQETDPFPYWQIVRAGSPTYPNNTTVARTRSGSGVWVKMTGMNGPTGPAGANGAGGATGPTGPGFSVEGTTNYEVLNAGPSGIEWTHSLQKIGSIAYGAEVSQNAGSIAFVDWRISNLQKVRLTGNAQLVFISPYGPADLTLKVEQDNTGNWAPVWSSSTFGQGVGSTLSIGRAVAAVTIVKFHFDGTYFWGYSSVNMSSGSQATTVLV